MQIPDSWQEEAKEAAQLVFDAYGEADGGTEEMLIWEQPGPWKRIIAYKDFDPHNFPAPHKDSVESFINYKVPPDKFSDLARFDGSVVANRTHGEISARCHDEQANFLALNLAIDIISGAKTVEEARAYYAKEFTDYRRNKPTPYMEGLKFEPQADSKDPDERIISEAELSAAAQEGQLK